MNRATYCDMSCRDSDWLPALFTLRFVGFWGLLRQIGVPCLDPIISRYGKNCAHVNLHRKAHEAGVVNINESVVVNIDLVVNPAA